MNWNKLSKLVGTTATLLMALAVGSSADPLGLVTVSSYQQARMAESILDQAYARVGNRFLVNPSQPQLTQLQQAGIAFETTIADADPQGYYQVLTMHSQVLDPPGLEVLGEITDFGRGVRIMPLSRSAALSVPALGHVQAVRLDELSVRIKYQPPAITSVLADDYPADALADLVDMDSLFAFDQHLQDFQTRYARTQQCLDARDWIVSKFEEWGYSVSVPQFYNGGWLYNIQATKIGVADPDKVIVIGGHYDSYNGEGDTWTFAPGADDNGSGVALTMEIARILKDVPLRKTIIFHPFAAEEIGLLGSRESAGNFADAGTKLEVMFNYDMVGYTDDDLWDFELSSDDVYAYRNLSVATANRVTELIPVVSSMGSSSDHYPFAQEGFAIVNNIEADFNYQGWHTDTDLTSMMDFPYLAEVTKMALVSLAITADAAYPVEVNDGIDPGDGQSLQVTWTDCSSDCSYMVYWGEESAVYTDSALVPAGQCSYTINGLVDGQTYYVMAVGESPNGYRALYGLEGTGTPLLYPRTPVNLSGLVDPDDLRLSLSWDANQELDLDHYNVYRRFGTVGTYMLYAEGLTSPSYVDHDVVAHVGYDYAVTAVDHTGYESPLSESVMLYPATFDGGLVIADGFIMDHSYDPDQAWQEAWLDTVLGGIGFAVASSDEWGGPVTLNDLGQYSTVMWIDDDVIEKDIKASEAALDEFSQQNTNMLISGYRTISDWVSNSVPTNHMLYREFGLSYQEQIAYFDFVGAHGQNGWPSVEIDPTRGMNEWRDIPKLTPRPGATVIGTFDSFLDLPGWEGEPVGLAYETANGKRVLLSFPLFYLTPASCEALLTRVMEYFGTGTQYEHGDLDHSGTIDLGDIAILLDHLFISQAPLAYPESADMDGRPGVSIGDAFVLIRFLFMDGPQPVPTTE